MPLAPYCVGFKVHVLGWQYCGIFQNRESAIAECIVAGMFVFTARLGVAVGYTQEPDDLPGCEWPMGKIAAAAEKAAKGKRTRKVARKSK